LEERTAMSDFALAFERTMNFEDDPNRPGTVTPEPNGCRARFGINEHFHPELLEEFWTGSATEARAQAEEIELEQYWKPLNLDGIEDQPVASKIFDMAVNMGIHQAAVLAQRSANFLLSMSRPQPPTATHPTLGPLASPVATDLTRGLQPPQPAVRLTEDGIIGPKTLEQLNRLDAASVLKALRNFSEAHYRHIVAVNPAQAVNLDGWLRRAAA